MRRECLGMLVLRLPAGPLIAAAETRSVLAARATEGQQAEALMRRTLALDEKILGREDPKVATDLNKLAGLLRETNRLAEAEPLMRRALAIDEKWYGPEHPKAASGLYNLAEQLMVFNRIALTETLMSRVITL